jgi:hypothetical protein
MELTGMGMDVVRTLTRQVREGRRPADYDLCFCRLAKAIRQLVALEMRLARALDDVAAGRWAAEEAERELRALADEARQDTAVEALEQAIRETSGGEVAERLTERLDIWRELRAAERDFTDKPVAQIVADACKAMGLDPDPDRLAGEAMGATLADAVRAYAAALAAAPKGLAPPNWRDGWPPPPSLRPSIHTAPRPPPN